MPRSATSPQPPGSGYPFPVATHGVVDGALTSMKNAGWQDLGRG